jgi:hypothetical protein
MGPKTDVDMPFSSLKVRVKTRFRVQGLRFVIRIEGMGFSVKC